MSVNTPIAMLVAPKHHVFLSPHYDDVALSCGGTASLLAHYGHRPTVHIIFGGGPSESTALSDFARFQHHRWGLDHAAVAVRREEETTAAELLGVSVEVQSYADAIYRGERYIDDELLFGDPVPDERDMPMQIVAELLGRLHGRDSTRIYAPLAVGGHVDHRHAFQVGMELAGDGWAVWFYEDQPYALDRHLIEERIATAGDIQFLLEEVDVSETWRTKIDAIMVYRSQLPVIFRHVAPGGDREPIEQVLAGTAANQGSGRLVERFWRRSASPVADDTD
jgi:LmbE family N-acetylglucosaminyl deacetylase